MNTKQNLNKTLNRSKTVSCQFSVKFSVSLVILVFSLVLVLCLPMRASAEGASLYLSPSSGSYEVGSTFSVAVKVNSGGTAINAADGALNFNINELEVVSISKTGSIFSLWTMEPVFSNSDGRIVFGGGTPTALTGTSETIITVVFKAKIVITTNVAFSSGSVLAADGKGTNVLTNMAGGTYNLQPKVVISVPPIVEEYVPPFTLGVPAAPKVSSPTHPDPEEWYSNNSPKFTWPVLEGITGVKLLYNKYPSTLPTVFYSSPISEKQLTGLSDGVWYLHCQLQNNYGWGGISHFKFQIDTIPPEPFKITVKDGAATTNPRPILFFETVDDLSGVQYYEVKIGEGDAASAAASTKHNPYQMPVQAPGKRTVIVKAVDGAGNYSLAMTEINILPIESPVIIDYPEILAPDTLLSLKGTSVSDAKINIYIQDQEGKVSLQSTQSNQKGVWYFTSSYSLFEGIYQVWAEAIDPEGAKSELSEKVTVSVKPPAFVKIGKIEISYLEVIIIISGLILLLVLLLLAIRTRLGENRKKLRKEAEEVKDALGMSFEELRRTTKKHLDKLEEAKTKRELTKEEEKMREVLKENLAISEKFIEKEIKDILRLLK